MIRGTAEGCVWQGVPGETDRNVLMALLDIATRCNKLTFHADYRTIALAAPVALSTIGISTRRLRQTGWLRVSKQASLSRATV